MSVAESLGSPGRSRPAATPAPGRYLRLVGPEEIAALRRHRRLRRATAALVGFVIALLFAAVGMHVVLIQNQFRLDSLNTKASAEQARYQQLQLQVAQLSAPSRILGLAQGQLGMVAPSSVNYLKPASATSGAATTATTATSGAATTATTATTAAGAGAYQGGPPPASAPGNWSTIKSQLAAGS